MSSASSDRGSACSASSGCPANDDARAVERVLGRRPAAAFTVAKRCPFGGPAVIESEPFDERGRPFPTRYWLACRPLVAAVSRLEAAGGVTEFDADESLVDARAADHAEHAQRHHGSKCPAARRHSTPP